MEAVEVADWDQLEDRKPTGALVDNTDLVIVRYDKEVSIMYGRCLHRGAMLSDGFVDDNDNLICGVHYWDYRIDSGVSEYNNEEALHKFPAIVHDGKVYTDRAAVVAFENLHPQPFHRDEYLGQYADTNPEDTEPHTAYIQSLAKSGIKKGHHGPSAAMGVDRNTLPSWDDIQYLPAQMHKQPLMDEESVNTTTIIGPNAKKPLKLDIPLFVSDMSFGALSKEAKIALSKGAEMAGTGICSGEGGMLAAEQENNSRYFYELASAKFGFSWEKVSKVQAFHFKGGQGAKTGTGGHLPGNKVNKSIAEVRDLEPGQDAISPATFPDLKTAADFRELAEEVRSLSGGIPIGFKIAASHIEKDIDFCLEAGADYIILDGRGGGTGAAPTILRDHINVPTIPALARARKHLDSSDAKGVSLIVTGGLRVPADFAKALMLGADAIAVANAAIQAVGCLGMRACHTNNCPVGIATQKDHLRQRLIIDKSAERLANFFQGSTELMKVISRACGHSSLSDFNFDDLSTFNYDMHRLTGISFAGVSS
ncbi:MAG: Rieske 2Fe-2S domain-containing protein [Bacteroidetes bacterium]|nr:Rieske 2Fe-2S domain-containing protein [Bacteroidota bacterium]